MNNLFTIRFSSCILAAFLFFAGMTALNAQTFTNGKVEDSDSCNWPWNVLAYNSNNEIFGFYEKNSTYKLVKWTGSSWASQGSFTAAAVGSAVGRGSGWNASDDVDMAIDGNNNIHVVFRMGATGACCNQRRGVFYAKSTNNGSSWNFTEIETFADPNGWKNTDDPAIAIGPNNNPHVVFNFTDSNNPRQYAVRYTAFNGSSWSTVENAWSQTGVSNEVSYATIDIDSNNKPHVAFQRETNGTGCDGGLWYTNKTGASWSGPTVIQAGAGDCSNRITAGEYPNLQVGANNKVYIVSYNYQSKIFLSTNASGSWVNTQVNGNLTGTVRAHAFNINANGDFFISYNANGDYKYAYKGASDNSWSIGTLHAKGGFSTLASTARSAILTDNGRAMGFCDAVSGSCSSTPRQLRYASGNLAPCTDTDNDGICDDTDTDDDNDGISDTAEAACGSNPLNSASTCEICDGLDNDLDSSTDEGFTDTDQDGIADCVDTDDDNDGISDAAEAACGSNSLNSNSTCEICDGLDNDLDSSTDEGFTDTDQDGIADCVDTDDDNDGVADANDSEPLNRYACRDADNDGCDDCSSGTDAPNNDGTDTDGDGLCDTGDPDDDNDGVADTNDNEPLNRYACRDADNDGCDDCSSGTDAPGNDGTDTDGDGICDTGDPDDDNDGVADANDNEPLNRFACRDADNDGCDDCSSGTDAPGNDGTDTDSDGICDTGDPDDDNDGQTDADEITCGSDPLDAGSLSLDTDSDNSPDCVDADDDNDTVADGDDNCPLVANASQADADTDGAGDACDPVFNMDVITTNTTTYVETLNLTGGQSNSLTGKLQDALDKYCNGKTNAALNKLNAFIAQVASLKDEGVLGAQEAAALTTAAENMIAAINGGTAECPPARQNLAGNLNQGNYQKADLLQMSLFPNPTSGEVNIRLNIPGQESAALTVFDNLGRVVLAKPIAAGTETFQLDLSEHSFTPGIYFVRVVTGDEMLTKQLAVSR